MFERFDVDARRALFLARQHAAGRGADEIEAKDLVSGALHALSPETWAAIRASSPVEFVIARMGGVAETARPCAHEEIAFHADARQILDDAAALATDSEQYAIRPLHLLAAGLGALTPRAAMALQAAGVTAEVLSREIARLPHDGPVEAGRFWDTPPQVVAYAARDGQADQITAVVNDLFFETDRKHWTAVRHLFVDGFVRVDMSSLTGEAPAEVRAEDVIEGFRLGLHADKTSHHMTTNLRVLRSDQDHATVTAHGYAWNRLTGWPEGEDLWETWGAYTIDLRRTHVGWKIEGFTYESRLARGNDAVRLHTREP